MTNLTIILAVIAISIIVFINIWPAEPKRSKKGGANKSKRTKKTNQPAKAKTDKKVRRGSK